MHLCRGDQASADGVLGLWPLGTGAWSPAPGPVRAHFAAACRADETCYSSSVSATVVFMSTIPARDLRNHTAEVLRRVEAGEEIEVLRDNRPVAKIIPLSWRRRWLPASEIASELMRLGPDTTGLAAELRETVSETTDDLPW